MLKSVTSYRPTSLTITRLIARLCQAALSERLGTVLDPEAVLIYLAETGYLEGITQEERELLDVALRAYGEIDAYGV